MKGIQCRMVLGFVMVALSLKLGRIATKRTWLYILYIFYQTVMHHPQRLRGTR